MYHYLYMLTLYLFFGFWCVIVDLLIWGCSSFFFFFKQKTAYDMRISDWSSDVCSSDLPWPKHSWMFGQLASSHTVTRRFSRNLALSFWTALPEIGRASCRERVCQYV